MQSGFSPIKTPVLVIGFNRPDKILSLLNRLENLGVVNLYVALDGPRTSSESSVCVEVLKQVMAFKDKFNLSVVWRDYNLGCNLGVVAALDWFFLENSYGIVLEDDCYPEDEMLRELEASLELIEATDDHIGMITAHNPFTSWSSKVLSRYVLIQGWGTTSKVWFSIRENYFKLTFPQLSTKERMGRSLSESVFWWANSTRARLGGVDTWDGIFADRMWRLGYRTLVPEQNLILNFGFDERATHTKNPEGGILITVEEKEKIDFDELMKSKYFKIHSRHFFTAPLKVILDRFKFKRKNYEEVLRFDIVARNIFPKPI